LLAPLARDHIIFNLFNYITFRAAGATVTALFFAFVIGPPVIRMLERRGIGQIVRAEGPTSHQEKRGTPTMGGLVIIAATVVPAVLWGRLDNPFVLTACGAALWMGAIGFLDDYLKIVQGRSRGLVARWKLAGQVSFGLALAALLLLVFNPLGEGYPAHATTLPFLKFVLVPMGPVLYMAFVTLVIAGSSNAVNFTDGLDGLASGLAAIAAGTFAVFAYLMGRVDTTGYLNLFYLPGAGELTIFCAALMGAVLGFLWFNAHPASVFMGDTGSLAIGGALGTVAILLKSEFLLVLIGGVFVAEAMSVILQTGVYKARKRRLGKAYADQHRLFRMAPLHHHFERLGWAESKIVTRFYILGVFCALVALATLKLR
jgi:phospho-N-acetylmuramoyl-pentapeptide-transferase